MAGELGYQDNAADVEQLTFADRHVKERVARRRELWRWVLSHKIGREFVCDVLLEEIGHLHHIGGTTQEVFSQVALHNLACRLMGQDIAPHRELHLQMFTERTKRDDEHRKELEAARVKWATDTDVENAA